MPQCATPGFNKGLQECLGLLELLGFFNVCWVDTCLNPESLHSCDLRFVKPEAETPQPHLKQDDTGLLVRKSVKLPEYGYIADNVVAVQ